MKYRIGFICRRFDYGLEESLYNTALSFVRSFNGRVIHSYYKGRSSRVDVYYSCEAHYIVALTITLYSIGDFV